VIADAALARTACQAVLHAVALEVREAAVIHAHRHVDDQDALGLLERFHPARQRAEMGRGAVQLLDEGSPRRQVAGAEIGRKRHGHGMTTCLGV
jgi:hypothetical protein